MTSPPTSASGAPFASGTVSLRLYPHSLPPRETVAELVVQAQVAEAVGFDGVMTSEHHAGFPNYLPNPLLAATWVLAATSQIWAAPAPILLPLKAWAHVVEDLAWTAARFPARLGAGFASGAIEDDFVLAEVPFEQRTRRFRDQLGPTVAALRGEAEGLLAADEAVTELGDMPVPVVVATQGPKAGARAGGLGVGILFDSIVGIIRAAEVSQAHAEAGGRDRVLIRRAWVGEPPAVEVRRQMDRYRSASTAATIEHWDPSGGLVADTDPDAVADELAQQLADAGCTALNLRVFQAGILPQDCRLQIEALGEQVLPRLRRHLAAAAADSLTRSR